ncbi:737_t:CDS:2, partial [Racocetra fulgida]
MATRPDEFDTVLEFSSRKYREVVNQKNRLQDIKPGEKLSEIFKKPEDLDNA